MKELELIKQSTFNYVDLDVFDEGEIYYIFDSGKYQSVVAVCLSKEKDRVVFKVIYYVSGDFGISTYDNDKFAFNADTPSIADMRIYPVRLSFLVDPMNMKLRVLSELELKTL